MKKRSRELKIELEKAKWEETKIMWENANWSWRIILILGLISIAFLGYKIGVYLGNLII